MRKNHVKIIALAFALRIVLPSAGGRAIAQDGKAAAYPAMASLDQYLISDEKSEIALARSAAPSSISDGAEVMVLGPEGYKTAVKGTNGFVCLVERSWGQGTDQAEFWNPKMRAPHCFNAQAARSFAPIYLMKTRLVLAGKSQTEIAHAISTALDTKDLPALEPGAMAYMMSKQQYLTDPDPSNGVTQTSWHPHVMFYAPLSDANGDGAPFGANLKGSPVVFDSSGGNPDPFTVFFVPVWKWSDGTPGPLLTMHH